ncbi:hypothetical protein FH972_010466 [Carpinus fangiana]|uniref:Uncharacterized protein n=1 Tax=Carpinus fangiana TaxID=176857 RepID=A0A660KVD7_9ROSI|nr:hypothetical protein FH972_010466 [Carpinus fangiana]
MGDIMNVRARLLAALSSTISGREDSSTESNVIKPTQIIDQRNDKEEKIKKFLSEPLPEVNRRFKSLGSKEFSGRGANKTDWTDAEPGVSKQTLAQIHLVAFSLKDKDGNHIFDEIPEFLYDPVGSMDADKLSDSNLVPKSSRTYEEEGDEDMEDYDENLANCYCYLACSYFRLYSKSAENFVKIQEHLKKRFTNFFS